MTLIAVAVASLALLDRWQFALHRRQVTVVHGPITLLRQHPQIRVAHPVMSSVDAVATTSPG